MKSLFLEQAIFSFKPDFLLIMWAIFHAHVALFPLGKTLRKQINRKSFFLSGFTVRHIEEEVAGK